MTNEHGMSDAVVILGGSNIEDDTARSRAYLADIYEEAALHTSYFSRILLLMAWTGSVSYCIAFALNFAPRERIDVVGIRKRSQPLADGCR